MLSSVYDMPRVLPVVTASPPAINAPTTTNPTANIVCPDSTLPRKKYSDASTMAVAVRRRHRNRGMLTRLMA